MKGAAGQGQDTWKPPGIWCCGGAAGLGALCLKIAIATGGVGAYARVPVLFMEAVIPAISLEAAGPTPIQIHILCSALEHAVESVHTQAVRDDAH